MNAHHGPQSTQKIGRARLVAAGSSDASALMWAGRGSVVLLVLAGVWFVYSAVRPLPEIVAEAPSGPPAMVALRTFGSDIDVRDRRLSELTQRNMFRPDRAFWDSQSALADKNIEPEGEKPAAAGTFDTASSLVAGRSLRPIDRIKITPRSEVTVAVLTKLKAIRLQAIFSRKGRLSATLGHNGNRVANYSAGDIFTDDRDGEWKILAIDPARSRVILSRGGQNFEYLLYDGLSAAVFAEDDAEAINDGTLVIEHRSRKEVRAELAAAGLSADEIEELLALADSESLGAPPDPLDQILATLESKPSGDDEAGAAPSAPPGVEMFLKFLQSDPIEAARENMQDTSEKEPG